MGLYFNFHNFLSVLCEWKTNAWIFEPTVPNIIFLINASLLWRNKVHVFGISIIFGIEEKEQ